MNTNELIRSFRSGDEQAFRDLFRLYGKPVYQRALAATGTASEAEAVLKNTFRDLYTLLRKPDTSDDPATILLYSLTDGELHRLPDDDGFAAVWESIADDGPAEPEAAPLPVTVPEPTPEPTPDKWVKPVYAPDAPAEPAAPPSRAAEINEQWKQLQEQVRREDAEREHQTREQAFVREYADESQAAAKKAGRAKPRALSVILVVVLALLILVILWMIFGLLRSAVAGFPDLDLGYSWFNQHILQLF